MERFHNPQSAIRNIIKPSKLKPNATIGIIAPSSPVKKDKLEANIRYLEELGYRIKLGTHLFDRYGYLAGIDRDRANDINHMFADPEVDAIFCARGGSGTTRIIPLIDYANIRRNPKIFLGYSDVTALLNAIHQQTGLIVFHSPMVESGLGINSEPFSREMVFRLLSNPEPFGKINFPSESPAATTNWKVLVEGETQGKSLAGCISVIQTLLGTPYEFDLKNKIFFCEDVDEEPYRIDRMLAHFKLTDKLKQVNAVVIGKLVRCESKEPDEPSLTHREIFSDLFSDLGIPVIYDLGFGHGDVNFPIPIGIEVKIDTRKRELSYLEGAVQ